MCGVRPNVDSYVSKEAAVENWNRRSTEDALCAERDAALAEAAKYKALWDAIPWEEWTRILNEIETCLDALAPQPPKSHANYVKG